MHIINRIHLALAVIVVAAAASLLLADTGLSFAILPPHSAGEDQEGYAYLNGNKELSGLKTDLERRSRTSSGEVSLCLYDYATGEQIEINGRKPLYPASMIKTLLLLAALEQVEQGELSLDQVYIVTQKDKYAGDTPVTGSGIIQFAAAETGYTLEQLLSLMVSVSDNVATNILFDLVGPGRVNAVARELSLENTSFTRKMYDLESPLPSNVSTARDLTRILTALKNREIAGEELSNKGIQMMVETTDKERIGRMIKDRVVVANKVGTVSEVIGDMALIYFPHRPPVALTIVVANPDDHERAAKLIGELAEIIVDRLAVNG